MKEYTLSIHDSLKHIPEKPERTGMSQLSWSFKYVEGQGKKEKLISTAEFRNMLLHTHLAINGVHDRPDASRKL